MDGHDGGSEAVSTSEEPVTRISTWGVTTRQAIEDSDALSQAITCSFWLMLQYGGALTAEEERDGWRTVIHDDHTHRYAVGWRAEHERKEADARREAEMAACPYVECECGHHEE